MGVDRASSDSSDSSSNFDQELIDNHISTLSQSVNAAFTEDSNQLYSTIVYQDYSTRTIGSNKSPFQPEPNILLTDLAEPITQLMNKIRKYLTLDDNDSILSEC